MTTFAERKKRWGSEMVFSSLSLPVNIIQKLKTLKCIYEENYGRSVSYGEIFERLLSPLGLGNVDPGVFSVFQDAMKSQAEFDEVVTRATGKALQVQELKAEANGIATAEEGEKPRDIWKKAEKKFNALFEEMENEVI